MRTAIKSISGWQLVWTWNRLAGKFKPAVEQTAPEVERLADTFQIARDGGRAVGFFQLQRDLTEMKAVRVFAHPVIQSFLPCGVGWIADEPAIGVEICIAEIFRVQTSGQRRAVPGPMRYSTEWKFCGAFSGKGLQSGHIGGEGEFTIANGERGERIELREDRIMPADERTAINARRKIFQRQSRSRGEKQTGCAGGLKEVSAVKPHLDSAPLAPAAVSDNPACRQSRGAVRLRFPE